MGMRTGSFVTESDGFGTRTVVCLINSCFLRAELKMFILEVKISPVVQ